MLLSYLVVLHGCRRHVGQCKQAWSSLDVGPHDHKSVHCPALPGVLLGHSCKKPKKTADIVLPQQRHDVAASRSDFIIMRRVVLPPCGAQTSPCLFSLTLSHTYIHPHSHLSEVVIEPGAVVSAEAKLIGRVTIKSGAIVHPAAVIDAGDGMRCCCAVYMCGV